MNDTYARMAQPMQKRFTSKRMGPQLIVPIPNKINHSKQCDCEHTTHTIEDNFWLVICANRKSSADEFSRRDDREFLSND